jgi:hypothetical protein
LPSTVLCHIRVQSELAATSRKRQVMRECVELSRSQRVQRVDAQQVQLVDARPRSLGERALRHSICERGMFQDRAHLPEILGGCRGGLSIHLSIGLIDLQ